MTAIVPILFENTINRYLNLKRDEWFPREVKQTVHVVKYVPCSFPTDECLQLGGDGLQHYVPLNRIHLHCALYSNALKQLQPFPFSKLFALDFM